MHTNSRIKRLLRKLPLSLGAGAICLLSYASGVSASQSCSDVTGTWGIAGDSWDLSHDANGKFAGIIGLVPGGTLAAIGKYPKCMGGQYAIIGGSRNGATVGVSGVQLGTVTGGQPNPDCPTNVSASLTMAQPGCDHGAAIATLDGRGISQQWRSQCKVPTSPIGEVTTPDGWDTANNNPIKAVFKATVQPTSFNFGGRFVQEDFPADAQPAKTDTCWYPNNGHYNPYTPAPKPGHYVDSDAGNRYEDDIGFDGAGNDSFGYQLIVFYRSSGTIPCSFLATQKMTMDCAQNDPLPVVVFQTNPLVLTISDANWSVSRNGVPQSELYAPSRTDIKSGVLHMLWKMMTGH